MLLISKSIVILARDSVANPRDLLQLVKELLCSSFVIGELAKRVSFTGPRSPIGAMDRRSQRDSHPARSPPFSTGTENWGSSSTDEAALVPVRLIDLILILPPCDG